MSRKSPRTYITEAFDILYPELVNYVYQKLSDTGARNDWWDKYIYNEKIIKEVFGEENNQFKTMPNSGDAITLRKFFDDAALLKLIMNDGVVSVFNKDFPEVLNRCGDIKEIRNKWAHRDEETYTYFWVSNEVQNIIAYAKEIFASHDCVKKLDNIYSNIQRDIDKKLKIKSHEEVYKFLDKFLVENYESPNACLALKEKIKRSRDVLRKTKTAKEVVDFFENALLDRGESYKAVKDCGLSSFEDIRKDFYKACYGDEY